MNPQTPFSWIPRGLVLAAATLLLISGTACAANPADDVPSAVVGDPITAVEDEAAMEDDSAMEEESHDDSMSDDGMSDDGMTEGEDNAAEENADDEGAMAADTEGTAMAMPVVLEGSVSFEASKVTRSHTCIFPEWNGALDPGEGTPETATLSFEVTTASVYCDSDTPSAEKSRFEQHLVSEDFLWSEMHPEATFVSTSIVDGGEGDATHTISGDLTIRGITQPISFPATVKVDDTSVAGMAEFAVDRQLWDIVYTGKADDLIRDEVVISLNLSGTR